MPTQGTSLRARLDPMAAVVVGIGLVGLLGWSRFTGIDQSLWHDEIHSVLHYMSSPTDPFTGSYVPNNHVLFNVLSAATTELLGRTETTLRLWSILPGIASVLLLAGWMIGRGAIWTGLATGGFLTISPVHLELSRQARGYGLTFLAMSGLIVFGTRAVRRGGGRDLVLTALFGAIGVLTLPVFVLPFIFTIAAMVLAGLPLRRAAIVVASVGGTSLVWYSPMLGDVAESTSQDFGHQLRVVDLVLEPVQLLEPTFRLVVRDVPLPLWVLLAFTLVALGSVKLGDWIPSHLSAVGTGLVILGPYAVFLLARVHIEDRFASYQLIPLGVLIVLGASTLMTKGPAARGLFGAGILLAASLLAGASFVRHAALVGSRPLEAFKDVGQLANQMGGVPVVANSVRPLGLDYYIDQAVRTPSDDVLHEYLCHQEPPFIFIDHPYMTAPADTDCLSNRDASLISLDQRTRGGRIDVWIVTTGSG